jgi:hypothetical protein
MLRLTTSAESLICLGALLYQLFTLMLPEPDSDIQTGLTQSRPRLYVVCSTHHMMTTDNTQLWPPNKLLQPTPGSGYSSACAVHSVARRA